MQLVVDTNIVVSALLRKGDTRRVLLSNSFEFFSPESMKLEVLKHKKEFMEKGSMGEEEFFVVLGLELENISVLPVEEYSPFKKKALGLCPEGHEDDWPFIAVALKLGCPLWSQDSALKRHGVVKVLNTKEVMEELR